MAMEREAWPGESDEEGPVDNPDQNWYFDLPGGAWERQEAKNRNLRDSVLQNIEGESRRRTFPGTEPVPDQKKGLFGRRKKQHAAPSRESAGGTFRLSPGGVDPDAWKHSTQESPGWADADDAERWTTEPAVRELPAAGRRTAESSHRDDEWPEHRHPASGDEDHEDRQPPLVLRRRRQVEAEDTPAGGRWSDAFGGSGSESDLGDRADDGGSTGSRWGDSFGVSGEERPRQRRILRDAVDPAPDDDRHDALESGPARARRDAPEAPTRPLPVDDDEPLQLRRKSQEPDDDADAGEDKPRSRWDEMFSAPADGGSIIEGLRKWSGGGRGDEPAGAATGERPRSRWEEKFGLPEDRADEYDAAPASRGDRRANRGPEDRPGPPREKFGVPPSTADERDRAPASRDGRRSARGEDDRMAPSREERWADEGPYEPDMVQPEERPRPRREEEFELPEHPAAGRRRAARALPDDLRETRDQDDRIAPSRRERRGDEHPSEPGAMQPEGRPRSRWEEKFGVPPNDGEDERRRIRLDQPGPTAPDERANWTARSWSGEHFEEPEIDEDLDLFRPGDEESSHGDEAGRDRGKGRGLGRIFGRKKSEPGEGPEYRSERAGGWLPPDEDDQEQSATPDWGSSAESPTSWNWNTSDDADEGVEEHFKRRTQERSRNLFDDEDEDLRMSRIEQRRSGPSQSEDRDRDDADRFGAKQERRAFTVPDGDVEESQLRRPTSEGMDTTRRKTVTDRPEPAERSRRPKAPASPPPADPGRPKWDPEPYERDEPVAPRRVRVEWQPEAVEPARDEYDPGTEPPSPVDDDDPWAGFIADRGLSAQRRTEPRTQPGDSEDETATRRQQEARWSE